MKILITGAKGMLGQALLETFSEGNDILARTRDEIDLTHMGDLGSKVKELKPDLIINAAAYNNVDKAEEESEIANAVNGYAPGNLAAMCKELDIPFVHYSTDYVFDGTKKEGYVETDEPHPISAYGRSKFLGEREVQKNGAKFYIIRLSKLFGKEPTSAGGKKSFVKLMLDLAKTKTELEVVNEEISCPTYSVDLARTSKYLLDHDLPYGIYHGVNLGGATWFEFAAEIFKIAELNVKLTPVPASRFARPAQRPAYGVLLNTKLPPARPWQEALREHLNFTNN